MRVSAEKVVALALDRVPPRDIAAQFNVPPETIYGMLRNARSKGADIPNFNTSRPCRKPALVGVDLALKADVTTYSLVIPNRLQSLLAREAERRGRTVTETAQRLLENALLGGAKQ